MKKLGVLLGILTLVGLGGVASAQDFSGGLCSNPKPANISQSYYDSYCAVYGNGGTYDQTYGKGGLYCQLYKYNC